MNDLKAIYKIFMRFLFAVETEAQKSAKSKTPSVVDGIGIVAFLLSLSGQDQDVNICNNRITEQK